MGGSAGYKGGQVIGKRFAIEGIKKSPEFRRWRISHYKPVFPILGGFMQNEEWEKIQRNLECPISLRWMEEPVYKEDNRYYEKSMLERHLKIWEANWTPEKLRLLSAERRIEVRNSRSAFRTCDISSEYNVDLNHYDTVFDRLKMNYNNKVAEYQRIEAQIQSLSRPYSREVSVIVNFYSKTKEEREDIIDGMVDKVRNNSTLSRQEKRKLQELLELANEPPTLLR